MSKAISRLLASGGEQSLHSSLGQSLLNEARDANQGRAIVNQTFVQTQYSVAQPIGPLSDIVFNDSGYGDIFYNNANGYFRLLANKKYRLTAHFALSTYSGELINIYIEWVDALTNAVLHEGHGAFCVPGDSTNSYNVQPTADTFHVTGPAVQEVKLRVTSAGGTAIATVLSGALVQEIA